MGKGLNIGVAGIARKGKKVYIGISGVARKVKKMYIGINGIARLFFSGGEISLYSGYIEPFFRATGTSVGTNAINNYAMFSGGYDTSISSCVQTVEVYNSSLTKLQNAYMNIPKVEHSGTNAGSSYTLLAGGQITYQAGSGTATGPTSGAEAFNSSLTRTTAEQLSAARGEMGAASVGDYAIFACGSNLGTGTAKVEYNVVDFYNSSLVKSRNYWTNISHLTGVSTRDYAIFGGGSTANSSGNSNVSMQVRAYNSSLVVTKLADLSVGRKNIATGTTGNYAIFCGGLNPHCPTVDVYNTTSLSKVATMPDLPYSGLYRSTSANGYAIFMNYNKGVAYNDSLTRTNLPDLDDPYSMHSLAATGEYVIAREYNSTQPKVYKLS